MNTITTSGGQTITISNGIASVVNPSSSILVNRSILMIISKCQFWNLNIFAGSLPIPWRTTMMMMT